MRAISGSFFVLAMAIQLVIVQYCYGEVRPDSDVPEGTIKGQVVDAETKTPLSEASVIVVGTQITAVADSEGDFVISHIPVGNYTLRFDCVGYETLSKTDVIVKSRRITFVQAELRMASIEIEDITVTAGYFSQTEKQATSVVNFSSEEIRRAPGSAGDVSRIISGLPSIAKINDTSNSLIVRGGSPIENGFFLDNIEIPNINHFPTQGSTGGPIGLLNVDFIQNVNFYAGGFSASYGDKLSSVMELAFREGNRDELDGQLDLSFAGFGVVAEGPIAGGKGSWLFSGRRSFLDLLVEAIGTGVAPKYSDYQGKLVYDMSPNSRITVLGVLGVDSISFTKEEAEDAGNIVYGDADIVGNTFGVNWQYIWSQNGYSDTSVSHTFTKYKGDYTETTTDADLMRNDSLEQAFRLRNVNHYRINEANRLEFGINAEYNITEYDNFFGSYTDPLGEDTPEFHIDDRITASKLGAYASYIWSPFDKLTATLGIRADYFSYNEDITVSPRLSLSYRITDRTSVSGSAGIFHQNLPLVLVFQNEEHAKLKNPVADHYILGINHLLTENTQLTIEAYYKEYSNFPLDPAQPPLFVLDELIYRYGFFFSHEQLVDEGEARSRGIELLIQKKLVKDIYGLASGSYSRAEYRDYNGAWKDRVFDNRYIFSVGGGYKPNSKWEFSMRWIYAGGPPYTPFDVEASESINRGVFDQDNINGARYSDYHSLNIRLDRRFYFSRSNLTFYLSVWNAYGRENVASYYWNEIKNESDTSHQWGLLPIFGLEYEF